VAEQNQKIFLRKAGALEQRTTPNFALSERMILASAIALPLAEQIY
jgi:hypothetical protein